nr:PREDICTED: protein Dok-7 isoform X2 [Latimeria chalumnae]|eukprot:XP_006013128.1 PREDICTED: protein Dok-7 isoform X2 [Latimeria chalumnae]
MTDSVVVEGQVKLRDGKKWKSRWVAFRKPSPVADCLLMLVYKDKNERTKGHKERSSVTLEDICGLDPGLSYEGVSHGLAVICLTQVVMLGFENKETMYAWDIRIRYSLGEGAGVFFLSCAEGERISFLFDCIVRGISPTRGPFGLRPVLPDPNVNPAYTEDRVTHEALELEKRLSLLSHTSRQSSAGDDRSISSSSSDTSHSDTSIGSRLTIWPEQSLASPSLVGHGVEGAKGMHPGEEKLYTEVMCGVRPPPKPLRPRKLQEIGRQSSSDSGIATGSHSSYSGSFSSYAGSLDICHGDEFGSVLSLPLNFASDQNVCTCQHSEPQRAFSSEYQVPSSLKHLYDTPRSLLQAAARETQHKSSDSMLSKDQAQTLQGISDSKLLLPHTEAKVATEQSQDKEKHVSFFHENTRDLSEETYVDFVPRWSVCKPQEQVSEIRSIEVAPSGGSPPDPCEICSPQPGITRSLFAACPICGGIKGTTISQSGVLAMPAMPEHDIHYRSKVWKQTQN